MPKAGATGAEVVQIITKRWEVQNCGLTAVEAGEMNELMRNELLWEYKQNGRWIRGLTAAMIAHSGNR